MAHPTLPSFPLLIQEMERENLSDSALLEVSLQMMRRGRRLSGLLRVSHVRIPAAAQAQYISDSGTFKPIRICK